jgi:hypothetical protein
VISIWLFVALLAALVAVYLLGLKYTVQVTPSTDGEHMIDGHDVKVTERKRGHGCCH